ASDGSDRGFLIPFDAKVSLENPNDISPYESSCLPMQEVWNKLDSSPAKHVAVIADACFSGLLTKPRSLFEENPLAAYLTMSARQAISAGGKGQKTWETDANKHGIFTFNLITELRRRAKEKQRVFSMMDLFSSIQDKVVRDSRGRQIPQINQFFTEGQMLFFAAGEKTVQGDYKGPDTKGSQGPKKPEIAKLVVKSNPAGAKVFVDGVHLGDTPFLKEYELDKNLKVKVRMELDGYEPKEKTLELKPKKEAKFDEKLKKLKEPPKAKPAKLTVVTSPAGATVFVDGEEIGASPLEKSLEISSDKFVTVRMQLEGYETAERSVDLKRGREAKLSVTLVREPEKPKRATLEVISEPKGAEITIDGVVQGKSPLNYSQEILATVSVSIKATLTGYVTQEQTATLDPNVPAKVTLILKKTGTVVPPTVNPGVSLSKRSSLAYTGPVRTIQFSPDGSKVAITGQDNQISIFDTASGQKIKEIKEPLTAFVRLSSDWENVLYIYLTMDGSLGSVTVMVQDMDDPKSAKVFSAAMGNVNTLNYAYAQSGNLIVCGQTPSGSASIAIIDLATGKSDSFQVSGRLQGGIASPDGGTVAIFKDAISATQDTNLLLLRGKAREDQQQVRLMDSNIGQKIVFAQSSDVVAINAGRRTGGTAQTQRGLKVYETRDGRLRFSSTKHVAIGFMAGGTRLLAWSEAQGGSIELFDAVSGASLGVQKLARPWLSEDGRNLLVPAPGGFELFSANPLK
ncbi:MAG: PEGA domain-containing protein, partial [Chlorobia bacterium]|nr:PEGA domain-containing protein [Fimbriimonadaceae bacterium]